jgi:hypothetical protein
MLGKPLLCRDVEDLSKWCDAVPDCGRRKVTTLTSSDRVHPRKKFQTSPVTRRHFKKGMLKHEPDLPHRLFLSVQVPLFFSRGLCPRVAPRMARKNFYRSGPKRDFEKLDPGLLSIYCCSLRDHFEHRSDGPQPWVQNQVDT